MLPEKKSEVVKDLGSFTILIHGDPKSGKSSFASCFDDVIFADIENGLMSIECYKVPINNWQDFLNMCTELQKTDKFKTLVIDNVSVLYQYCLEHVCAVNNISYPSDENFGKGWGAVRAEFNRVIGKLVMSKIGVISICHSAMIEYKTTTRSINRYVPKLSKQAMDTVVALSDIILYFQTEELVEGQTEVKIKTKPHPGYYSGDRTKLLPESIKLDTDIPMNTFKEIEGYFKGGKDGK